MAAASGCAGMMDVFEQRLSLAETEWRVPTQKSTLDNYVQPTQLLPWQYTNEGAGISSGAAQLPLEDAIRKHPQRGEFHKTPKLLYTDKIRYQRSEAEVASAFYIHVCKMLLEKLAKHSSQLPDGMLPWWLMEATHTAAGQQSADAMEESSQNSEMHDTSLKNSKRIRPNMMLVLEEGQHAGDLLPARKPVLVVQVKAIAELMEQTNAQMTQANVPMEQKCKPVDLLAAYNDKNHCMHVQVRGIIAQLFTYVTTLGLCHGCLTCWNVTWLVYVSHDDRSRMYISPAILATAANPTLLRAMSWLQLQALHFATSKNYPARRAASVATRSGGGVGPAGGGGSSQPCSSDGSSDRGSGGPSATGASDSAGDPTYSPSSTSIGQAASSYPALIRTAAAAEPVGQHQAVNMTSGAAGGRALGNGSGSGATVPTSQPQAPLQFLTELAQGRDGTIFDGLCHDERVIIKVYNWEGHQVAAYFRETRAYRALAPLQGTVVPKVLAQGRLTNDLSCLRCLVMQQVEGARPLSIFPRPLHPFVVRAALRALEAVQATAEGFVHGDIRLDNILLVGADVELAAGGSRSGATASGLGIALEAGMPGGTAGAATPVSVQTTAGGARGSAVPCTSGGGSSLRCMLLDFGSSRLGGTASEQAEERAKLRRLLGVVQE